MTIRLPSREFWARFLSPATARFVLALLALFGATGATYWLMAYGVDRAAENVVIFALGLMFGLAKDSFGYYFGSTARNDERPTETTIVNDPAHPVPTEEKG